MSNFKLTLMSVAVSLATSFSIGNTYAQSAPTSAKKAPASMSSPLKLTGRTELPGYDEGDFDHFEVDLKGNRLFLAAEDHGTLEVFDLKNLKHLKTIKEGIEVPHGLLYLPEKNRLIVTDSGKSMSKIFDASTYKVVGTIKLKQGADSMAYDPSTKRAYIANGGKDGDLPDSYLTSVDPSTGKVLAELKFDTNKIEAMAIEQKGKNLFMNITGKNYLAVIDKEKLTITSKWPIKEAEQNAPLAFDEENHRLFVATRKPGKMIVVNAATGATVASFNGPLRCDQIIFDQANHLIYMLGGEGYIGVYQQKDADHYVELPHVSSAPGAKTGILIPEMNRLLVIASPGETKATAAILQYEVSAP